MYLTEDEAREKWCPEVRSPEGFTSDMMVAANENMKGQKHTCIASDCMMWRWFDNQVGYDAKLKGKKAAEQYAKEIPRRGYCGLAGRPE